MKFEIPKLCVEEIITNIYKSDIPNLPLKKRILVNQNNNQNKRQKKYYLLNIYPENRELYKNFLRNDERLIEVNIQPRIQNNNNQINNNFHFVNNMLNKNKAI